MRNALGGVQHPQITADLLVAGPNKIGFIEPGRKQRLYLLPNSLQKKLGVLRIAADRRECVLRGAVVFMAEAVGNQLFIIQLLIQGCTAAKKQVKHQLGG
ncbi:hypothetical protein D3C71_1890070 [compost metagenome]